MKCKKCNSTDILTRYIKQDALINSSSELEIENKFIKASEYDFYFQLKAKIKHLKKHYRNCQYSWLEDTKDTKEI